MHSRFLILGLGVALGVGFAVFVTGAPRSPDRVAGGARPHDPVTPADAPVEAERIETTTSADAIDVAAAPPPRTARVSDAPRGASAPGSAPTRRGDPRWLGADVETLKQAIYAHEIDTVAQLDLLEEFIQTDGQDTREYWETEWTGVDDWKRNSDGFSLERSSDGSLLFVPGEETARAYSFLESINAYEYDEASGTFVNEVDYYGKQIFNVVQFVREDVLLMMVVSGEKVDLNIYERGATPAD